MLLSKEIKPYLMMNKIFLALLLLLSLGACNEDPEQMELSDDYDRSALLVNWADNLIIPAYEAYVAELAEMVGAKDAFLVDPTVDNLADFRDAWLDAYLAWQEVSMFEIGEAETLGLRDFSNTYPTSAERIEENISMGNLNLVLPSTRDQQGFPALDYLLHAAAVDDPALVNRFQQEEALRDYTAALVDRLHELGKQVLDRWKNGYRETFVAAAGSDAGSSLNKMANDFMFYYERALRAGKIGIPAGVFSNTPLPDRVEGYYRRDVSKMLFMRALEATKDFFNGRHFDGNGQGESLASYLDYLDGLNGNTRLSEKINTQFDAAFAKGESLGDDFVQQVEANNTAMLQTYDALQGNVVLMKVDMFQTLNIRVDYVDADGD